MYKTSYSKLGHTLLMVEKANTCLFHVLILSFQLREIPSLRSPCRDKVHIATTSLVPPLVSFIVSVVKKREIVGALVYSVENIIWFGRQSLNLGGSCRSPIRNGWWGFQRPAPAAMNLWTVYKGQPLKRLSSAATRVWILLLLPWSSSHKASSTPDRVTMSAFVGKYAGSCCSLSQSAYSMPASCRQTCSHSFKYLFC